MQLRGERNQYPGLNSNEVATREIKDQRDKKGRDMVCRRKSHKKQNCHNGW